MKSVSNLNQLQALLKPILIGMVDKMAERVYETLNFFLQKYYDSYDPVYYRRTYEFLKSAVKVDAKPVGNEIAAYVYIDTNVMSNYYYGVSGEQVVRWANKGLHGGKKLGHGTPKVWNYTIKYTVGNDDLLKLALDYLRSKGFNVRR